jgi:hypothetical protein
MNKIALGMGLTNKLSNLADRLGVTGKNYDDIKELVMKDDADEIIESHYYPEYARPHIRQPSDDETEMESENLFKDAIMLTRLATADIATDDCIK